jgi:rhodanese-related sulfurtransferase
MRNVFFLVLLPFVTACKGQNVASQQVAASDFEKGISNTSVQVLDVRTAGEYKTGHIKNALLADWNNQQQFADRIQYVDKDKPVYIYCLAGGRSAAAAQWLRKNGYQHVIELQGGINAWKKENKPLEGLVDEKQMTLEEYKAAIPADKITLVDFGATWCPPCIKMMPVIDELVKDKNLQFQLVKIDGGIHLEVMKAMNVEALPVFIIYKNGVETWRKQGIVSKEELTAQLK